MDKKDMETYVARDWNLTAMLTGRHYFAMETRNWTVDGRQGRRKFYVDIVRCPLETPMEETPCGIHKAAISDRFWSVIPRSLSCLVSDCASDLGVGSDSNVPWYRYATGTPPQDSFFSKKLYDSLLFIVLSSLDVLDQVRFSLVSKIYSGKWQKYLRKNHLPTDGYGLALRYKCACHYALCVHFENDYLCIHGSEQDYAKRIMLEVD